MEIKGRNVITGLPATITVSSDEIRGALAQTTNQIADAICAVLEKTPPELASDVSDRGIILTGDGWCQSKHFRRQSKRSRCPSVFQ